MLPEQFLEDNLCVVVCGDHGDEVVLRVEDKDVVSRHKGAPFIVKRLHPHDVGGGAGHRVCDETGAGEGIRTLDIQLGKLTFYH